MDTRNELLQKAITGEHNAIRRYIEFARVAEQERLPNAAYLFKALVTGERVHLENHKRALGSSFTPTDQSMDVGTTVENLKVALAGETEEFTSMYPAFIKSMKRGKTEADEIARLSFEWALGTEKTHAMVLQKALERVQDGKDYLDIQLFVCLACGNLHAGDNLTGICPVCKHDDRLYKEVLE